MEPSLLAVRRPNEFPQALSHRLEYRDGESRISLESVLEVSPGKVEATRRSLGDDIGRPGSWIDQRDLPEHLARGQLGDGSPVLLHLHTAVEDHVQVCP